MTLKITANFDADDVKKKLQSLRIGLTTIIDESVKVTAELVLKDTIPFVPRLTGRLRDSGRIESLKIYLYKLIWDAANIKNNFIYAEKQYSEVLNHIDGRYAAKWVERVFSKNKNFYVQFLFNDFETRLSNLLGSE